LKKIDLGQGITILANVGVIVGIAFLAIEIRQNNQLLRAEAISALLETRMNANQEIYSNSDVAELRAKNARGEPLTDAEQMRMGSSYARGFQGWQRDYFLFQEGILTEDYLRTNFPTLKNLLSDNESTLSMIDYWNSWKPLAPANFRAFVEQCLLDDCDSIPR
jgi:hypothetical protein